MPPTGFQTLSPRALWDNAVVKTMMLPTGDKYITRVLRAVCCSAATPIPTSWIRKRGSSLSVWYPKVWSRLPSDGTILVSDVMEFFYRTMTVKRWMMVVGVVCYLWNLRWIRLRALEAGPVVIILTALVAILRLGSVIARNNDGLSAYSAFNKGFQQLMGVWMPKLCCSTLAEPWPCR
jgi:hypothetical protein